MTDPGPARTLTVDRARHDRVVRDLVVDAVRSRGSGWFGWAAVALVLVPVTTIPWYADLGLVALALWVQMIVWRQRAEQSAEHGLAVGQTVTVAYTDDGDLTVTDATGHVVLPRGSVAVVRRAGGNTVVLGRSMTFVLPGELLTDTDIAFLEGHGPSPVAPERPEVGPNLPLSLQVTPAVQDQMVAAASRSVMGTADFLFPLLAAGATAALGIATQLWFLLGVAAFFLVCGGPQFLGVRRVREQFRRTYAVGRTMRAAVTPDHLTLSRLHGTSVLPWATWTAARLTEDAVLLRQPRRRFGAWRTDVVPKGLFGADDLAVLATAVPRRF